jgi:universal stress protein A
MANLKKILVPVDFSECAWAALRHATLWADRCGAELHFLHVVRVPWYLSPPRSSGEEHHALEIVARIKAEAAMVRFIESINSQSDRAVSSSVTHGTPRNVILDIAELNDYDLIVMGTHGRTGLTHLFLGSTTEGVVRRAPCPVLTVGRKPKETRKETAAHDGSGESQFKRILVPVDFSLHSTAALEYALKLRRLAQITLASFRKHDLTLA